MSYARPAGMSSDEDDSDNEYDYYIKDNAGKRNRNGNYRLAENDAKPLNPEEALFTAVKSNNIAEVSNVLLSKGVTLELLQSEWTPLMYACFYALPEMVKFLLDKGSDINFNRKFFTPLMAVCNNPGGGSESEKIKCIRILLDQKIDVNAVDRFRMNALMFAAKEGLAGAVKMLIENGCKINEQDKDGWTALFHAVCLNRADVVDILLSAEADKSLKDVRESTVYELAVSKGLEELAKKVKFEEVEDVCEPSLFTVQPVITMSQMLNELPSRNAGMNPGFPSDIYGMLEGMDLINYADCFYKNNIQLGEFLVIDDERLREIGVIFSHHRQTILKSIRRFHLHKWQKTSLITKSKFQTLELLDGVKIIGNVVRQLYVLQSTMSYILANRQVHNVTNELKRAIQETRKISEYTELEMNEILQHAQFIDQVKKVRVADLITSNEERSRKVTKIQNVVKICLVVALGFAILWKQKRFRV